MKYTFQYTDALLRDRITNRKFAVVLETKLNEIAIAVLFYRKIKFLELIFDCLYLFLGNHAKKSMSKTSHWTVQVLKMNLQRVCKFKMDS